MEGSGEKAGAATQALPHSSPAGGGSSSAGERSPLKFPHTLLWVIPGTRSRPPIPASFSGAGRQDGGPQGGTEGQEPPGQFTVGPLPMRFMCTGLFQYIYCLFGEIRL